MKFHCFEGKDPELIEVRGVPEKIKWLLKLPFLISLYTHILNIKKNRRIKCSSNHFQKTLPNVESL